MLTPAEHRAAELPQRPLRHPGAGLRRPPRAATCELRLTSAGHPTPLIVRADGTGWRRPTPAGTLVGVTARRPADDRDGHRSRRGSPACSTPTASPRPVAARWATPMFGEERLRRALAGCAGMPAEAHRGADSDARVPVDRQPAPRRHGRRRDLRTAYPPSERGGRPYPGQVHRMSTSTPPRLRCGAEFAQLADQLWDAVAAGDEYAATESSCAPSTTAWNPESVLLDVIARGAGQGRRGVGRQPHHRRPGARGDRHQRTRRRRARPPPGRPTGPPPWAGSPWPAWTANGTRCRPGWWPKC